MGQTTITVDESTLERFKSLKEGLDREQRAPAHTNESFLEALMDTWEAVDNDHYQDQAREETLKEIVEQLNNLDTDQTTLDGKREIINRIDDLEAQLPAKIAEQLQQ